LFYLWFFFNLFILALLAVELRLHRPERTQRLREALGWSIFYVALAVVFAVGVYFWQGHQATLEFVTAYVLSLSLSIDNLFVFLVIFKYFAVPNEQQHRVLFWGVVGALIMRGVFIGVGVGLIVRFHWVFYIFGVILIYSGIRLGVMRDRQLDPATNPLVKALRRLVPVTSDYRDGRFFVRDAKQNLRLYATPLLVVLVVIETSDLLFSVDSIPAVLAITLNAFIVYSSIALALLGLRSMYFAVAGLTKIFRFLHYGLAVVLVLVGLKMMTASYYRVATPLMLAVVAGVVLISVVASLVSPEKKIDDC
jgi:tellurite resistance protein TerC